MSQDAQATVAMVVDRIRNLPSMPGLVLEILDSINDERADVTTLANKIARDQALVARVMRVANSAFFGLSGQVSTISEAISILGFSNLRGLVTAAAIINAFPKGSGNFDWAAFWRHSIITAACARALAKRAGVNPDIAFTAGVLHDIGRLVIAINFPHVLEQGGSSADESSAESLQAERDALGFDHAVLGGELARRWKFPSEIRQAIAAHHLPPEPEEGGGYVHVIHVANLFAHALAPQGLRPEQTPRLAAAAHAGLGLDPGLLPAVAEEIHHACAGSVLLIGDKPEGSNS